MVDLFKDKAEDWDDRPIPAQISEGVYKALCDAVQLSSDKTVMDFGAGTGLICMRIAPLVKQVIAVDVSQAMLEKLAQKAAAHNNVEVLCQNLLEAPLERQVDVVVSAMAMHHVEDTRALMQTLHRQLAPGGSLAMADLDAEDGSFHPPNIEGVYHHGFGREALASLMQEVGFRTPEFRTACVVHKDGKQYPIFLATASKTD